MTIDDLDFRHIELLDTLLRLHSVSATARHLDIPQPTASHGLARLREALDDQLLVRVRGGMQPTPKALAIVDEVDELLRLRQRLVDAGRDFDPATLKREFVVAGSDVGQMIVLSALHETAQPQAPGLVCRGVTLNMDGMVQGLESGDVDLALGPYPRLVSGIYARHLYDEGYKCFALPDHPFMVSGDMADFLAADHVVVSSRTMAHSHRTVERQLMKMLPLERVRNISSSFLVALVTALQTGVVATLPGLIVERLARQMGLRVASPPIELPGFEVKQYWHARNHHDPAHQWLRGQVHAALSTLPDSLP